MLIAGKEGGKAKPLKKPKTSKDYDEDDKEFLKKKKVIQFASSPSNAFILIAPSFTGELLPLYMHIYSNYSQSCKNRLTIWSKQLHRSCLTVCPLALSISLPTVQEEEAAMKKARDAILKGKKK